MLTCYSTRDALVILYKQCQEPAVVTLAVNGIQISLRPCFWKLKKSLPNTEALILLKATLIFFVKEIIHAADYNNNYELWEIINTYCELLLMHSAV